LLVGRLAVEVDRELRLAQAIGLERRQNPSSGLPSAEQIRLAIAAARIDESDLVDQRPIVDPRLGDGRNACRSSVALTDPHDQPRGGQ
jgi:hypothetical protein